MGFFDRFKKKKEKKGRKSKRSVGTQKTIQKKRKKIVEPSSVLLKEWTQVIKRVENHPLSQARLINTKILEQLTEILTSMDQKLENLKKLDEIISLLSREREELEQAGVPTESLDSAIAKLKGLSTKDKEAVDVLKKHKSITTEQFAKKVGLSRSTASSRLNKLHSLGLLKKMTKERKIIFKMDKNF